MKSLGIWLFFIYSPCQFPHLSLIALKINIWTNSCHEKATPKSMVVLGLKGECVSSCMCTSMSWITELAIDQVEEQESKY